MQPFTALFTLPTVSPSDAPAASADWRQHWTDKGIGTLTDWNAVRVIAVRELLWLIPSSPASAQWLHDQLPDIATAVAERIVDVVPLELRPRPVSIRWSEDQLWAYRVRRLVIAKGAGDWSEHFKAPLTEALTTDLERLIESGIRRDLAAWGKLPTDLAGNERFLAMAQPGRPFIIPAIQPKRSGHARPVHALVRDNVVVLSSLRIEGAVFAGKLNALGYGRLQRTTAPDMLDSATQRRLLSLPQLETLS